MQWSTTNRAAKEPVAVEQRHTRSSRRHHAPLNHNKGRASAGAPLGSWRRSSPSHVNHQRRDHQQQQQHQHSRDDRRGATHTPSWRNTDVLPPPPPPLPSPPWSSQHARNNHGYLCSEEGLSQELTDFARYVGLNAEEHAQRQFLIARIEEAVRALWVQHTPEVIVYGSYALGLSVVGSDIDMTLTFDDDVDDDDEMNVVAELLSPRERCIQRLRRVAEHLRTNLFSSSDNNNNNTATWEVELHELCRVPVLKMVDVESGLQCDVSASCRGDHRRTRHILCAQREWLRRDERAASLLIIITKAALKQWGTNCVHEGGISSTALYSLVHRFLGEWKQHHALPQQHKKAWCEVPKANEKKLGDDASTSSATLMMMADTPTPTSSSSSSSPRRKASEMKKLSADEVAEDDEGLSGDSMSELGGDAISTTPTSLTSPTDARSDAFDHTTPTIITSSAQEHQHDGDNDVVVADVESFVEMYGATPARLLMEFWRYLSADTFLSGYDVADAFHPSLLPSAVDDDDDDSGKKEEVLDGTTTTTTTNMLCNSNAPAESFAYLDLTAGSFRLPEVLALFCHSTCIFDGAVAPPSFGGAAYGRASPPHMFLIRLPSLISAVFADPRSFA